MQYVSNQPTLASNEGGGM